MKISAKIALFLAVGLFLTEFANGMTVKEKEVKEKKEKEEKIKKLKKGLSVDSKEELENICDDYPWLKSCELSRNTTLQKQTMEKFSQCNTNDMLGMVDMKETWEHQEKTRRKRTSNYNNPCHSGSHIQQVLMYVDTDETPPEEVEVYHDINNHVYRTFFILECVSNPTGVPNNFECQEEKVKVKAAVWDLDTYVIKIKNIVVPATCSLFRVTT